MWKPVTPTEDKTQQPSPVAPVRLYEQLLLNWDSCVYRPNEGLELCVVTDTQLTENNPEDAMRLPHELQEYEHEAFAVLYPELLYHRSRLVKVTSLAYNTDLGLRCVRIQKLRLWRTELSEKEFQSYLPGAQFPVEERCHAGSLTLHIGLSDDAALFQFLRQSCCADDDKLQARLKAQYVTTYRRLLGDRVMQQAGLIATENVMKIKILTAFLPQTWDALFRPTTPLVHTGVFQPHVLNLRCDNELASLDSILDNIVIPVRVAVICAIVPGSYIWNYVQDDPTCQQVHTACSCCVEQYRR